MKQVAASGLLGLTSYPLVSNEYNIKTYEAWAAVFHFIGVNHHANIL